ncbi:hypothetical protein OBBRIDRAFT_837729 [Obba rivulosa]|uniref:Uncharacterized protein n=1 Tax=Obba rivulosa TaxID=1052685 RepID=A0A8E2APF5_9APHY|nr:hypothetical protein OBBRIDRAFT_837729 [Obba rivulosa]
MFLSSGNKPLQWLYILVLFTKSDFKTTIIPITFFTAAASPNPTLCHVLQAAFWTWLQVLQFDLANQTMRPEEDEYNKRDRPLPSGRLTLATACKLRWILVPICWAWSASYSKEALYASVAASALTVIYNECATHSGHWTVRNLVNAAGYASFEVGATVVATPGNQHLDRISILSVCISASIYATTIQTQDFKDIHGDRLIGRRTLPIIHPALARYTVIAGLLLWSIVLTYVWDLEQSVQVVLFVLSFFISYRFVTFKDVAADQVSFYWYNVWLSVAHALPGYYRYLAV